MAYLPIHTFLGEEGPAIRRNVVVHSGVELHKRPARKNISEFPQRLVDPVGLLVLVCWGWQGCPIISLREVDVRRWPEIRRERCPREPGKARCGDHIPCEWHSSQRIGDCRSKVPCQHRWGWDVTEEVRPLSQAQALVVGQPEGFVPAVVELRYDHRTAHHKARLILPQRWDHALKITARVKRIVAQEPEDSPVKVVRPALADDVHLIRAEAILG